MKTLNIFRPIQVILICIAIAACQAPATPAPTDTPAPSNQSADLCAHPYIPAVEGATWSYSVHNNFEDTTQVDTVTDVGTDGFLVEVVTPNLSYVITWTCTPEGLLWLQSDGGMFSAVFQGSGWTGTIETLSYSGVTIPRDMQPGDTWSTTEEVHAVGPDLDMTFNINTEIRAVGFETITVPAGTFEALRLDYVMSNDASGFSVSIEASDWYAAGIGHVKLIGVINSGMNYEYALESYSIP